MVADTFEKLNADCLACHKCSIADNRHHVVISSGNPNAKVMFIGEGPGENEDLQGEPFVGKAGQFLTTMLELIGIDRKKDIYICNVIKCRPPQNRDPSMEERQSCRPFLDRQIDLIHPELVVLLGRIAATELLGSDFRITQQHGQMLSYNGIPCIATFHPSALLRDETKRPDAFSDFRTIRKEIKNRNLL